MSTSQDPSGQNASGEPDGQPQNPAESPEQQPGAEQPFAGQPYSGPQDPYGGHQFTGGQQYVAPQYGQQPYGAPVPGYAPVGQKSKIVAGILGILLGAFGVHNFYLGFTGKAVAQLLITVLTLGILSFVSAIWGLIEGILILVSKPGTQWHKDASGMELQD